MVAPNPPLSELIACPKCDALYHVSHVAKGERAVCQRCHAKLIAPRKAAGMHIIALSLASVILVVAALFLPFIGISRLGFSNQATIIEIAWAFAGGPMLILSLATLALIVGLPLLRLLLTLYTLIPLVRDKPAWPGAARAFKLSEDLRPWSMAEIFVIGCAVSLVKLGDLARVELGPAFFMFCILVVLLIIQDTFMDRWSVWKALER